MRRPSTTLTFRTTELGALLVLTSAGFVSFDFILISSFLPVFFLGFASVARSANQPGIRVRAVEELALRRGHFLTLGRVIRRGRRVA